MKNVCIFSGSFNPIHIGHQKLAEHLIDKNLVDEVWFVVSPCNPLKKKEDLLDENLRLEMLKLAIKKYPRFKVCDIEFTMPIPSYTIDTLNKLSDVYPDHTFSLMIGSDNAIIFDKWKNYTEILKKYNVFVYPRSGYDFSTVSEKYPEMNIMKTPYYDMSSTQIRESILQKKDLKVWLNTAVYQFIKKNNLYEKIKS